MSDTNTAAVWRSRAWSDPRLRAGALVLGAFVLAAILTPWLASYDPSHTLDPGALKLQPPSLAHVFGTDELSRDVLSRILFGTHVSLGIALGAAAIALVLGTGWGAIAGWRGGMADTAMMSVVNTGLALPRVLILMLVAELWGAFSPMTLAVVLGLTGWFATSRFVRTQVRAARELPHVLAARALGASEWQILRAHVLPAAVSPALVAAALGASQVLVLEAGLAIVGLGLRDPTPSWGGILYGAFHDFTLRWWLLVFPGGAILVASAAFTAVADALGESGDPRHASTGPAA